MTQNSVTCDLHPEPWWTATFARACIQTSHIEWADCYRKWACMRGLFLWFNLMSNGQWQFDYGHQQNYKATHAIEGNWQLVLLQILSRWSYSGTSLSGLSIFRMHFEPLNSGTLSIRDKYSWSHNRGSTALDRLFSNFVLSPYIMYIK